MDKWLTQEHTVTMWNLSPALSSSKLMLFPHNHTAYLEAPHLSYLMTQPSGCPGVNQNEKSIQVKDPCMIRQLEANGPKPRELPKCVLWVQ